MLEEGGAKLASFPGRHLTLLRPWNTSYYNCNNVIPEIEVRRQLLTYTRWHVSKSAHQLRVSLCKPVQSVRWATEAWHVCRTNRSGFLHAMGTCSQLVVNVTAE